MAKASPLGDSVLRNLIDIQNAIAHQRMSHVELLDFICIEAQRISGATGAVIELVGGDYLEYQAATGSFISFKGFQIKKEGSLSGLCIAENKSLLCYDSENDSRVNREACRKVGARSMAVVPLVGHGLIAGVLKVASSQPNYFDEGTVEALTIISGFFGAAILRAKFDDESRRRAELEKHQLIAREQAAMETARLKSDFLAHMSHEIRTPINGVIGVTELLLDTALTTEQKDYAETIRRSGQTLITIVNDVLDLSKLEAGKVEFLKSDFNLKDAINDVKKTLTASANKAKITLKVEFANDLPEFANGDHDRIKQILFNLVGNAIKFTKAGHVIVRAKSLGSTSTTAKIRIEVEDTGIGISEQAVNRIFSAFTQAESDTQKNYGGTGLGLSISKTLVERMKGKIGVESKLNVGSMFWFELDLDLPSKVMSSSKLVHKTTVDPTNVRILLAEDNDVNQLIARKMLQKLGYHVDVVHNGKEAVAALATTDYSLVLMDCQMPEMDGYEATRTIRSGSVKNPKIPIIAMTANAMAEDAQKCRDAGMNDYITKPVTAEVLAQTLERALSEKAS